MKKHEKPRMFKTIVEQFPLAIKSVAKRSELGHEKYSDIDQDWQGFTKFPIEQYEDALVRHLMQDGEENETELDHLAALAWNTLAILELKLRNEKEINSTLEKV